MATAAAKPKRYYKLFRVLTDGGKVTTVSMDPTLVYRGFMAFGDAELYRMVRQWARQYSPDLGRSRSGYVRERLLQALPVDSCSSREPSTVTATLHQKGYALETSFMRSKAAISSQEALWFVEITTAYA